MPPDSTCGLPELGDSLADEQQTVRRYFSRKGVCNREDLEDLTQETFLRALKALPTSRPLDSLRGWLLTTAESVFIDYLRKMKRGLSLDSTVGLDTLEAKSVDWAQGDRYVLPSVPDRLLTLVPELRFTPGELAFFAEPSEPEERSWVWIKRRQRALRRLALIQAVLELWGVREAPAAILAVSSHLRGGPLEAVFRHAAGIRGDSALQSAVKPALEAVMETSTAKLRHYAATYSRPEAVSLFRDTYCLQRTVALLSPSVLRACYVDLSAEASRLRREHPLIDRLFSRMMALTGDPEAIAAQHDYWRGAFHADIDGNSQLFAAVYCAMYFAPTQVGHQLLAALHSHDQTAVRRLIRTFRDHVRGTLVREAHANLGEEWYQSNQLWAETNFLRMHLALAAMYTNGAYGSSMPLSMAKQVWRVAGHARRNSRDTWLQRTASGIIGGLESQHGRKTLASNLRLPT